MAGGTTIDGAQNRPLLVAIDNSYADYVSGNPGGTPDPSPGGAEITSLNPATAVHGGADLTLNVIGTGFVKGFHEIVFNGGKENTTWVNGGKLTTTVKPSLVSQAIAVPVTVSGAEGSKTFTFT
jgi:hypothetical protein